MTQLQQQKACTTSDMTRRELGRWGEDTAAEYLLTNGYDIVERNWRCREGEIDLIAYCSQRSSLIAVEVKTRRHGAKVAAWEAVSPHKLARLRRLFGLWLCTHSHPADDVAIDLIAITVYSSKTFSIDHRESVI